jgi:hypothetical protein
MIIAIDPGRNIGYALMDLGGTIVDCGTVQDRLALPMANLCVIEMPRVYPIPGKWKGDPQQIVQLAFGAGMVAAQYPRCWLVEPKQWKGSLKKDVMWRRVLKSLQSTEAWLQSIRTSEHARDAVGIAVWARGQIWP